MKDGSFARDERTISIENASYRWAYLVLSFGMLLVVAYKSLMLGESSWELLALVILGGLVATSYQAAHRVLTQRWAISMVISVLLAGAIAVSSLLWR